jgi:ribose transport system ATP-binding protein
MKMEALQLESVSLAYGETHALDRLNLTLKTGEILGLVGANGAGKSTLVNVLSGLLPYSTGMIAVNDVRVSLRSPRASIESGIAVAPQEPQFAWNLSLRDNIILRTTCNAVSFRRPRQSVWYGAVVSLLERFGLHLNDATRAESLSRRDLQILQLAIVIAQPSKILLLDEPTTALTEQDKAILFALLGNLQLQNTSILFISHRIEDVLRICSTILVLRDGQKVCERQTSDVDQNYIMQAMHGSLDEPVNRSEFPVGSQVVLRLNNFETKSTQPTYLVAREGEIVGVLNEGGNASELFRAIMAVEPISSGSLELRGNRVHFRNVREATQAGLRDGVFPNLTILLNIIVSSLSDFTSYGYFERVRARDKSETITTALRVKYRALEDPILTLSGGNQQKVMLARLLISGASIMLLEEPTSGMDKNSKVEFRSALQQLARTGKTIIVSSNDEIELNETCSRIVRLQRSRSSEEGITARHLNSSPGAP